MSCLGTKVIIISFPYIIIITYLAFFKPVLIYYILILTFVGLWVAVAIYNVYLDSKKNGITDTINKLKDTILGKIRSIFRFFCSLRELANKKIIWEKKTPSSSTIKLYFLRMYITAASYRFMLFIILFTKDLGFLYPLLIIIAIKASYVYLFSLYIGNKKTENKDKTFKMVSLTNPYMLGAFTLRSLIILVCLYCIGRLFLCIILFIASLWNWI